MSYATKLANFNRRPQTVIVITLDYCDRTFGNAPCTATGSGDTKCYNTRVTCLDPANYQNTTGKEYKFCLNNAPLPFPGETVRPYLEKEPSYLPIEIDPKRALTVNARIDMTMYDEPDNDIGIDPYVIERSAYPDIPGRFFKKLIARNPYYRGRKVEIKRGFLGLDESDYQTQEYILDQIQLLDKGIVKIICKDLLKRADRVQVPIPTDNKLTVILTAGETTTANTDDTSDYPSSGYFRVNDEIIKYASKTGTTFATLIRAQFGTTAVQHEVDDKIQLCYTLEAQNVTDAINNLLQTEIGIASANINTTDLTDAKEDWLGAFTFTGIVSVPTQASMILREFLEQCNSYLFWDDETSKIRFKVFAPDIFGTSEEINDDDHHIKVQVDRNEKSRISRCIVYYNKINAIGDLEKPESYSRANIFVDADAESAVQYNETEVYKIYSRWVKTEPIASTLAARKMRRFRNGAIKLIATLDLKDIGIKVADIIGITTGQVETVLGSKDTRLYQITKRQQISQSKVKYTAVDTSWEKKYVAISPTGVTGDYDSATAEQQRRYGFIVDANEKLGAADEPGNYIY